MTKLLFIVVVTILLVLWFKYMARSRGDKRKPPMEASKKGEDMVRCTRCGVNLPRSEAIQSRGRFYCCDAHRQNEPD